MVYLWTSDPCACPQQTEVRFQPLDLGKSYKIHLWKREGSENMARLAEGQVYLEVNFLFLRKVVCSSMSVHVGGEKGIQRFFFWKIA